MKRIAAVSGLLLALSACAAPQYGVLAAKTPYALPSVASQVAMANDTYSELSNLYPAGSTTWAIRQETPDTFGTQLVSRLRGSGYAVSEYAKNAAAPAGAVPLNYVLDNLAPNYWRVQLVSGSTTFTRSFVEPQTSAGYTSPIGAWVKGVR